MKKYTLEDIKKLPAMQMEYPMGNSSEKYIENTIKNLLRHQLLEEMKE